MTKIILTIACSICLAHSLALGSVSASSQRSAQSPHHTDLQQRLDKTERSMQQMIANHEKLMAQLKKLENNLDRWQESLHKIGMKIEGK